MELKQLEFFVKTAEFGSINQAAEALYTSQSNVSKVIGALEKSIGASLFERNSKGVILTNRGDEIYKYAKVILKNAEILKSIAKNTNEKKFSVSCYPSHMITSALVEYYKKYGKEQLTYEFYEGTVEEITDNVASRVSEIGILYFSEHQMNGFKHVLGHKHLEFHELDKKEACIYVGKKNPLYNRDMVDFSELENLPFVQPVKDFFSLEHHLDTISIGAFKTDDFKNKVYTNSDNLLIDLLLNTDMCSFGIYFIDPNYETYDIKPIRLEGCCKCLVLGYVQRAGVLLSDEAKEFLDNIKVSLKRSF